MDVLKWKGDIVEPRPVHLRAREWHAVMPEQFLPLRPESSLRPYAVPLKGA
ncbi:hypothetical protein [Stygiolobus caldivivus]|uniref:hypothetical protein n=1 Tax=Stygiolobus caldivivus TaxID=2824673 RepID=UPI001C842D14|nr:hypothetical protein [Stygiolobus caldivivus]